MCPYVFNTCQRITEAIKNGQSKSTQGEDKQKVKDKQTKTKKYELNTN